MLQALESINGLRAYEEARKVTRFDGILFAQGEYCWSLK